LATRIHQMYLETQPKTKTEVVNIKVAELRKRGYRNLEHWLEDPNHVYIGRNMTFYVPGSVASKWKNPYKASLGQDECLRLYREHILTSGLINDIEELRGKQMGCWCKPESCHGDVLVELLEGKSPSS